ncbi:MAG: DNA polymerase IV [Treponemataceae bacterium]
MKQVFFHIDIDAFFASVEILDQPTLKGKPVIVGGTISRGVVSTCSYEARDFGVHAGMPLSRAKKLCPNGVFLPTRMERYQEKSDELMTILKSYTPEFHQLSIDEGFLNMSGTELLLGKPKDVAKKIKETLFEKTQLKVSIGIARTKYFAKLASDFSKPDGLYEIKPEDEIDFIRNLPMRKIWGIGKVSIEKLNSCGIMETKELAKLSLKSLKNILGNAGGQFLYNVLNARVEDIFNEEIQSHSISSERTFENDITNTSLIEDVLFQLVSEVNYRLVAEKVSSNTAFVKIRYSDFKTYTVQKTGSIILNGLELFNRVRYLFYQKYEKGKPIRLLGVGVLKVCDKEKTLQGELFTSEKQKSQQLIEETALEISKKAGKNLLTRARLLKNKKE